MATPTAHGGRRYVNHLAPVMLSPRARFGQVVVYRTSETKATRLMRELVSAGIPTTLERYSNAIYLVIDSDSTDPAQLDRFVRSRVDTITLVPDLGQL